ncbi:hypothetical protein SeLEV6574_g01989 [Synchytrium endobioticum]|uniref:Uncharacterized protein n=1 Tax=Synchytrium endobioticum TaxID=286115 RepID=A0A507DCG5_9FUNG|nr:hypothetical protein SeLEV6574_g01989 [Synchytrium endobioticum]
MAVTTLGTKSDGDTTTYVKDLAQQKKWWRFCNLDANVTRVEEDVVQGALMTHPIYALPAALARGADIRLSGRKDHTSTTSLEKDVQRLAKFYKNVLGFTELTGPPFDFEGMWLALPNQYQATRYQPDDSNHPSLGTISLHVMERHETRLPVNDSVFCGSDGKWRFQED